jgi:hypothetical protein
MADHGASLLLLREADVVRVCGLAAAGQALEVVRAGGVNEGRRIGSRLSASVGGDGEPVHVARLECGGDVAPSAFTWACTCPRGQAAQRQARTVGTGSSLACVHVAALMTQWLRHPAGFLEEQGQVPASTRATPAGRSGVSAWPVAPAVVPSEDATRADVGSLRDHLSRMSPRAVETARQCVLGEAADAPAEGAGLHHALYDALTDAVLLAALCASLDDAALLLLRGVLLNGGALTESGLAGLGERAGLTQAALIVARHDLRARCLLFPIGDDSSPAGWAIPAEVRSHLDIGLGLPALETLHPSAGNPSGLRVVPAPLRTLCLALTLMARTRGQLRSASGATTGHLERLPAASDLPPIAEDAPPTALETWARAANIDLGMARLAHRLVQAGLDHAGAQHPVLSLDRLPVDEWAYALRLAAAAWLDSRSYAELADLRDAQSGVRVRCDPRHAAFSLAALAAENASARARITRLLALVRPASWYALDAFVALVWKLDPFFLRGRQRAFERPAWWIDDAKTGRPLRPDAEHEWMRAEGEYIRALVAGPLHGLGLVDIACDGEGTARAFRCCAWTSFLLGATSDLPADSARLAQGWGEAIRPAGAMGLSVQPLALVPTGAAPLDAWAVVTGVRGGRLMWRLSADSFCAHLDAQRRSSELVNWLRLIDARDGTHAATHVAALFDRWQRQYGASRIEHEVIIVDAQDDLALHEALAAVPELAADARILAPGVAALPRRHVERLEQALAARGYLV